MRQTHWRSSLYSWLRHARLLKRTAACIVLGAFALSWLLIVSQGKKPVGTWKKADWLEESLRQEWRELKAAPQPEPRRLAAWLRRTTLALDHLGAVLQLPPATWSAYKKDGRLAAYETAPLLRQHLGAAGQEALATDYIQAMLAGPKTHGEAAALRVKEAATRATPPPLAALFYTDILAQSGAGETAAMDTLFIETRFPDAKEARQELVDLALHLKHTGWLRHVADQPAWLAELDAERLHGMAEQLADPWLGWRAMARRYAERLSVTPLLLSLAITLLWCLILGLHMPGAARHLGLLAAALLLGAASVWGLPPWFTWQEDVLHMRQDAPFPQNLWFWVAGVGLREETVKLLAAALLMPWLLRLRQPGAAALAGAFVGLGFAMDENMQYYQAHSGAVVATRFFSANFLHAAMTGIATHALYVMLRSRLARADMFLATFGGVVLLHGGYDFALTPDSGESGPFLALVAMAACAWRFLDTLEHELPPGARGRVPPAAVFLLGSAFIIAGSFLATAVSKPEIPALTGIARNCLQMAPMVLLFWQRFR